MYDVTNDNSFKQIDKWRKEFIEYSQMDLHEITRFPYLLLANKSDLIRYHAQSHYNTHLNINDVSEVLISGYCRDNDFNLVIPLEIINIIFRFYMNLINRGREYAKKHNMIFYEVSALNGMNIETAMYELMKKTVYYESAPPWVWSGIDHDPQIIEEIEADTNVKHSYCCGMY